MAQRRLSLLHHVLVPLMSANVPFPRNEPASDPGPISGMSRRQAVETVLAVTPVTLRSQTISYEHGKLNLRMAFTSSEAVLTISCRTAIQPSAP